MKKILEIMSKVNWGAVILALMILLIFVAGVSFFIPEDHHTNIFLVIGGTALGSCLFDISAWLLAKLKK